MDFDDVLVVVFSSFFICVLLALAYLFLTNPFTPACSTTIIEHAKIVSCTSTLEPEEATTTTTVWKVITRS